MDATTESIQELDASCSCNIAKGTCEGIFGWKKKIDEQQLQNSFQIHFVQCAMLLNLVIFYVLNNSSCDE